MEFTPTLIWSQTYEDIEIEINLPSISNEILRVENNVFHFECLAFNKKYLIDFELEAEVSGALVSIRNDKKMVVLLKKKEEGEKWDFLTKKRGIYKNNIKINWDKWENSDDEEDVKNIDMGGMGGMGGMMGGMNGMNGMNGMDSGMDMDMLQKMMDGMGHNGEEGSEEGEEGEEGSEEGEEEGSEEGKEEGCEDDTKNIDMGGIEGLII